MSNSQPDARTSKQCAIWHRANAVEVPDVPEMIDHPGDTVSCFLAISDGFRVGRARWHYPTKSWCHKDSYDGNVLFWSLVPNWDRTSDETQTPASNIDAFRDRIDAYFGPRKEGVLKTPYFLHETEWIELRKAFVAQDETSALPHASAALKDFMVHLGEIMSMEDGATPADYLQRARDIREWCHDHQTLPKLEYSEHCGCCVRNKITVEVFGRPAVEPSEGYPGIAHDYEKLRYVLSQVRDHSTDDWAKGIAREAVGPQRELSPSEAASFTKTLARSPRRVESMPSEKAPEVRCGLCGETKTHGPKCGYAGSPVGQ